MNKKIVIATFFSAISVALLLFFFFYAAPVPKFRRGPDLVDADFDLGYLIASSDISFLGKVVESVDAGEPLFKDKNKIDSREFKKFKAKIAVLMKVKGKVDEDTFVFDYFSPKYEFGFFSLSVGDIILFAPKNDRFRYPFWADPYITLSAKGYTVRNLWYENIDFKKGAEILKLLGHRVYNSQAALNQFERFYGKPVPDEFAMTIATKPDGWIIRGKCNRLFSWGCAESDFCYSISSFNGELKKCAE